MPVDRRSLEGLGILAAVVESGSFVRAGEALGLTQSAVSRAVSRLEQRVGLRLFARTVRAISLTEEGRRFHDSIAPHLAAIEAATIEVGDARALVRGRLRIDVSASTGEILAQRLGPFLAAYPDLAVELVARDRMGDLVGDGFDAAIRFGRVDRSSLKLRLLLRTRIATCASPAYLARAGTPRRPRDIANHRCILMRDPSTGVPFGWDFVRGKTVVTVAASGPLQVNEGGAMLSACLAGHGIAQLLELTARDHLDAGRLVRVLPEWSDETYPLYAYYPGARSGSPKVAALLAFLVDAFR